MQLPIVRFNRTQSDFSKALRERVDAYFKETENPAKATGACTSKQP